MHQVGLEQYLKICNFFFFLARIGRASLTDGEVAGWLKRTPNRRYGSTKLFRNLHDKGTVWASIMSAILLWKADMHSLLEQITIAYIHLQIVYKIGAIDFILGKWILTILLERKASTFLTYWCLNMKITRSFLFPVCLFIKVLKLISVLKVLLL